MHPERTFPIRRLPNETLPGNSVGHHTRD